MAENTKIEWAHHTWNFWWGCVKVSEGCANCYAETLSHRFGKSIWGPASTTNRERKKGAIANLRKWNKQAAQSGEVVRVFAQSMSDFFEDHPQLSAWRAEACAVIDECSNLVVMLLTKRPENILRMVPAHWLESWPSHVWIGTSVENQETADKRIPELLQIPARVRFLSMEPLLGAVDLSGRTVEDIWIDQQYADEDPGLGEIIATDGWPIHWVIVGGESGHNAHPIHPDWVRSIREQCVAAGVAFHFKQWGEWSPDVANVSADKIELIDNRGRKPGPAEDWSDYKAMYRVGKRAAGRLLDGRTWDEFPC